MNVGVGSSLSMYDWKINMTRAKRKHIGKKEGEIKREGTEEVSVLEKKTT